MIDKSWYEKPEGMTVSTAAGGVVVRREGDRWLVALVTEDAADAYILPKGRVERGESIEEAAKREIAEEAGLGGLRLVAKLGVRERLNFRRDAWKVTHYFLFTTDDEGGDPEDQFHDYEMRWFPLDRLPRMFWPEQEELLRERRNDILRLLAGTGRHYLEGQNAT